MYFQITNALTDAFTHGKGFIADHIRMGHADIKQAFLDVATGTIGSVTTYEALFTASQQTFVFEPGIGNQFTYVGGTIDQGEIPLNNIRALTIRVPGTGAIVKTALVLDGISMSFDAFFTRAANGTLDRALLAGNDTLVDNNNSHAIKGFTGNDTIRGNAGDDTITGGFGHDTLSGGVGKDHFIYNAPADSSLGKAKRDIITDFTHGTDKIDLGAILSTPFHFKGLQPLKGLGDIHYSYQGTDTVVTISTDADAMPEMELYLKGHVALTGSDFIL